MFYGIQHLENFLLIFFLVPHRAVPDLQRMKRCYSAARVGTEVGISLVQ
jgi:hypothetical protein